MASRRAQIEASLQFPLEGVNDERAYFQQRVGTSAGAQNVRSFDRTTKRAIGGARSGLSKYFASALVGDYPIQEINHLVTTDSAVPSASFGQIIYAMEVNEGFGMGTSSGVSSWTNGNVTGFQFACSCWDDNNNVYVATVNSTVPSSGVATIYKVTSAGVEKWQKNITGLATGSIRNIAGMVVIGDYLYVAYVRTASPTNCIAKLKLSNGTNVSLTWRTNSAGSISTSMVYSTSAINCLGKCGVVLGVECRAATTLQCFIMIDTTKNSGFKSVAYGGTGANNRSSVCSDGNAYFYVLACQTVGMVKKIGLGGSLEWSSTAADTGTVQDICYDKSNGFLLAVTTSTPSCRRINLLTGLLTSSADPGAETSWNNIDTDGNGFYTLYRNADASNDIMGINSSYSTIWGPTLLDTLPTTGTTHDGVSVNKGPIATTPRVTARATRLFGISGGECRRFTTSGSTAITGGTLFSLSAPRIFSAQNGNDLYFVDGTRYLRYQASSDSIIAWTPGSGTMPVDSIGRRGRLLVTWRGRCVIAGLPDLPQNFYMSKQFSPLDWDYFPSIPSSQQAFSGNSSLAGYTGDIINCLLSYSDDTMLFGCDHSIYQLTGDPMGDGEMDRISETLGMAWGKPYAVDPAGQIFFFGSDCAIYKMSPGAMPIRASQAITKRLQDTDLAENIISMAWDQKNQGLGVWITPLDELTETENYFWEERVNAWWPDFYGDPSLNPPAVHVYDGDVANDRVILLGGQDGKIRFVDDAADDDDGEPIESFVLIGPIKTQNLDAVVFNDMQPTLGETSGEVRWDIYVSTSAEKALISESVAHGTWRGGRGRVAPINRYGFACYVKLSATNPWSIEKLIAHYTTLGIVRKRG